MRSLYYDLDQQSAFSSVKNLTHEARRHGIFASEVEGWLRAQDIYARYKPARKHFPLNFYNIRALHDVYEVDLNDMRKYSECNDGYSYFLVMINCFSRIVWTYPLLTKTGAEVAKVFDTHFSSLGQPCRLMQSDHGKEFISKTVQKVLQKFKIKFRTIENAGKACMAERVNRTLKSILWKHMEHVNSWRWLEPLQQITRNYNRTPHRATGMRPIDVSQRDVYRIWSTTYLRHTAPHLLQSSGETPSDSLTPRRPARSQRRAARRAAALFQVGDFVRVSHTKDFMQKGYTGRFSREIYKVVGLTHFSPFLMYTLADLNGEVLKGHFYSQELLKVAPPTPATVYRVEQVLQKRHRKGHAPEILVRWQGYPKSFDTWEPESALQNI